MKERTIKKLVKGQHAIDGAGVHLVRVIGYNDVKDFDPFLMLDSFDSKQPDDYIKGFPMHPHRGIETVTYLIKGNIEHQDSLGNKGSIDNGESQWMSAGSGILHQEMPQPSEHLLGLQLWINLPRKDKMSNPHYMDIRTNDIQVMKEEHATIRIVSGEYNGMKGIQPRYVDAYIFDVSVDENYEVTIPTREVDNVFIFTIQGDIEIGGKHIEEKTAVLFDMGDKIRIKGKSKDTRFIYFAGKPLHEPIAWGGPIVTNTREELELAFDELNNGTFIKHNAMER
ncbi:redox-sensitive bicupin YhaK (pirin superfamily) [Breznakia sp. PF5-3]|uniref:pirin family protein n=1 Tax=unclassified Breznakia TaxID=2623764 RepID=UPI002406A88F|nr:MULTISPECIES: pirin family protein [unclassified Breznakia]MDL2276609.1 pirin family protein [Breznakia sp. OttesenSCG-928-G09]MDF9824653.1 redox-sensitive bicupin YhaK (pirin superfamily) [Breznakia sp. PM6-1]MDF9835638.1 redox-sensitive bicupin YhaK (pirin superfamily) [Breznakia sp. PF5-3]MDF9837697.1 redox-sensitive bicupin YhaK (pirin superfamily) [Breznakia sp. PFB2-8]MDF9859561.1 redox-sensitive bicupin YhaK (pirin superfamily) [Breznakia sp. PH5-24]